MRLLLGSWDGLKSRDVCMSSSEVIGLVDCMFFCCMRKWPLLVARDLAKCLVTRDLVRPGHESKCEFSTARSEVDGAGLHTVAW